MSRANAVPKYRRHPNGQAFVCHRSIASRDHRMNLGVYGSPESLKRYQQFLKRLELSQSPHECPVVEKQPTIEELMLAYEDYAGRHYQRPDGSVSQERSEVTAALSILGEAHGEFLAEEFGPKYLRGIQRRLAEMGYARSHINHTTSRIKRFFKWASSEELIDPVTYDRLRCVDGLAPNEFGVRDTEPVRPASLAAVHSLLPFVSPTVGAMMQTQYLCAMRPDETCSMRVSEIDRREDIWVYRPATHKSAWRGKSLAKAIPQTAQAILRPYLEGRAAGDYLFSPQESAAWARALQAAMRPQRATMRFPCEARRVDREKSRSSRRLKKKAPGLRYTTDSYRRAINYGIAKANRAGVEIERFSPNQLRHAILTYISQNLSQQSAQRYAGHASLSTTGIYAQIEESEMKAIARQLDARWQSAS